MAFNLIGIFRWKSPWWGADMFFSLPWEMVIAVLMVC